MLLHVAFIVNDSQEIESFYEDVLLFALERKFTIIEEVSQQIFNVQEITDVYVMSHQDIQFEIFVSLQKETKVFSHVCLTYREAEIIYNNAVKSGYKALIKNSTGHNTYFIWDKSGNIFEIKEMQD